MNSRELFERRDELKHVISEMRLELKDVEEQLSDIFLPVARDVLRAKWYGPARQRHHGLVPRPLLYHMCLFAF